MSADTCTIVMYHYVRELDKTRYPDINALTETEFRNQLDYLETEYSFITMEECIQAVRGDHSLPNNPVLLTFDDGFLDHYTTVYPILERRDIQGSFFPPAKPIRDRSVLDVHKIHFVLAQGTIFDVKATVFELLEAYQSAYNLRPAAEYYDELAESCRFDSADVVFVKRLLQRELHRAARTTLINELFDEFVDVPEAVLANELYMTTDQLMLMSENGMYIGSHGFSHRWLGTLSKAQQRSDIQQSFQFLDAIGIETNDWVMCYPYGSYNEETLELLEASDCSLGLTTQPQQAELTSERAFTLSRIDTNDLPQ